MNRTDAISACITKNGSKENEASFYSSALISYAATNSHEDVEKILEKLKQDNLLTKHMLLKLIRCYGFNGDIAHVSKYMNMCNTMFPGNKCDKTMLLIAHKVTLENICKELERTRGVRGLSLKPDYSRELDQLHESWSALTKDMFTGSNQPVDITDCNVVLEYLTFANRIDPVQFPMELAENIFESYMPANYIKPNDASHRIMLVGYATSQQYNHHYRNIRLDKALEVVSKMQVAGINTLNHPTFHSLFRACLPHRDGNYYFDNFRLNSLLPSRPYTHNRFNVDHRVFEIESIMLEAKLPHDRFTFTTLMTCLAAGGQYRALRSRWRALKVHGLRRDLGMYRLSFALASLDPTQAKRAIVVVRNEMKREIGRVDWETYTAMLDCCVTAQLPTEAKDIMAEMSKAARIANKKKTHADDLAKWPFTDEPDFYLPMLRAAINLPTLNPDQILKEMHDKGIPYNQGIYEAVLSKLALENDEQGIRRLFNQYTMSRFEKEGKIPVPVREAAKPVVPFPTAPYNALDMQFIDVYICSLLDSQDISLVFDVLRTLVDQTDKIGISRQSLEGIVRLAKQEKDKEDLIWFKDQVLPKVTHQNKSLRLLKKKIDMII
jgi:pentatricopeptide repeat protein